MRLAVAVLILSFGPAGWALGQSSSLFKQSQEKKAEEQAATTKPASNGTLPANAGATNGQSAEGNKALKEGSLTAVKLPEPKVIMVNDFVGVVVRYQFRQQSSSKIKQDSKWVVIAKL